MTRQQNLPRLVVDLKVTDRDEAWAKKRIFFELQNCFPLRVRTSLEQFSLSGMEITEQLT